MRRIRQDAKLASVVLMSLAMALAGCGGYSGQTTPNNPGPNPSSGNVSINGQYNLVLTSTNGHGTTNIYTNFTQTGNTVTGAANTLVCPSNDPSQCKGDDAVSITPSGTVSGANVTVTISFPSTAGANTVTLTGTATGSSLAGTYTDSLGDAGTWTASAGVNPASGILSGTFNSTKNPLLIAPTISITFTNDDSFNPTGTATIMNSPCVSSLTLSGQGIGEAFSLTDSSGKWHLLALPTAALASGANFAFSYSFDPTAASCAGDFGLGELNWDPWGY